MVHGGDDDEISSVFLPAVLHRTVGNGWMRTHACNMISRRYAGVGSKAGAGILKRRVPVNA